MLFSIWFVYCCIFLEEQNYGFKQNIFFPQRFSVDNTQPQKKQLQALDTLTEKAIMKWIGIATSATNAVIHRKKLLEIPTNASFKMWKKSPWDQCKLCMGRQTTGHCLNICKVSLNTGRWTWRHNNIVNYLVNKIPQNTQFIVTL